MAGQHPIDRLDRDESETPTTGQRQRFRQGDAFREAERETGRHKGGQRQGQQERELEAQMETGVAELGAGRPQPTVRVLHPPRPPGPETQPPSPCNLRPCPWPC